MSGLIDRVCVGCRAAWDHDLRACLHCGSAESRPRGFIEMTADFGIPLPEGDAREAWIDAVLEMVEQEGEDHFTSHTVFCHKVLGEDWTNAMVLAARFRDAPLTREACHRLADDWWEPTPASAASGKEGPTP